MNPQQPNPGTDNARLLDALLNAYPYWFERADSRLQMKANSRAAELRKLGWVVECDSVPNPDGGRKRIYRYRLAPGSPGTPRTVNDVAGQLTLSA